MKNRYFIYGFILLATLAVSGCDKESNVVAPSDATITVTVLPDTTVKAGSPNVFVRAVVASATGPMNGVAVRFISSNPDVANFGGGLPSGTADTDDSGVAEVQVFGVAAGSTTISADISSGESGSVSLTVN